MHKLFRYTEQNGCHSSGYCQVADHLSDQDKTAFVTADGLYNFKILQFGLCNSGATFERLMELVLAG